MKPDPEKTLMICGQAWKLNERKEVVKLERAPVGDWAIMAQMADME